MAERVSIIGSTSAVGAPSWRDDELQMFEKLFLTEGVVTGLAVSERGAGANMSVDIAAGTALIEITNTNLTPSKTYKVYFDVDAVKNVAVTTADATNPRKDRLVLEVLVSANPDAAAANIASVRLIAGTPAGSPVAPAEPANAITLVIIDVPASDTTIGNAQITDSRTYAQLNASVLADIQREATALKKSRLQLNDTTELTIASGVVTATQPTHRIDTESNAASDDLDTINAGFGAGEIVILFAEHTDRTVRIKHATGNIRTADGLDFDIDNTDKAIVLYRKGSTWQEIARAGPSTSTNNKKIVKWAREMDPTSTAGCSALTATTSSSGLRANVLKFDPSTQEHAHFAFVLPDDYTGTTVKFRIYWFSNNTGTGTGVVWGVTMTTLNDGDDFNAVTEGTQVTVTDTKLGAFFAHKSAQSGAVTIANSPSAGDVVTVEIARVTGNASDDYDQDADIMAVEIDYSGL